MAFTLAGSAVVFLGGFAKGTPYFDGEKMWTLSPVTQGQAGRHDDLFSCISEEDHRLEIELKLTRWAAFRLRHSILPSGGCTIVSD